MENINILKIQIQGIIQSIKEYTSEPNISVILSSLETALSEGNIDVIHFACKEIDVWYRENLLAISSNSYVFNKESHKKNSQLIHSIFLDIDKNKAEYGVTFSNAKEILSVNNFEFDDLIKLFNRFHQIVIQLRDRYNGRETLDVNDEYDVQDLLHSLLRIHIDDIRPEEWTPSYAGTSSRQDFLLKNEQIVIETKKTRKGLGNKELADELIIDIARYKTHPNCKSLICFIYDPENRIKNARGFEKDLTEQTNKFRVAVIVRP